MHTTTDPLTSVEQWDDYVQDRYRPGRAEAEFRDYDHAPEGVRELYRQNHEFQTLAAVQGKQRAYERLDRESTPMWEILERLNALVDESDPDTDLPQIAHALQTAEKIREDGHPDWMQLVGLLHDTGKMLCFYGEPQWAVVGDTFPVGCAWSDSVVFPEFFAANADNKRSDTQTLAGVYEEACGLDNVHMSWGHDEYIWMVLKDSKIPDEGLAMLRYHSFYSWHREGAYKHFMNDDDHRRLPWVQKFSSYDLYSKSDAPPDVEELKPYYQSLIAKYLPERVAW